MKHRVLTTALLTVSAAGLCAAQSPDAAPPPAKIQYADVRYADNAAAWRKNPEEDCFNSIKDIPLAEGVSLSLGGQVRLRYEHWQDFGFGAANDDGFLLGRLRLHADLRAGDSLRVFVEGKAADSTHRDLPGGRRPLDRDRLDLQNAFVDILLPDLGGVELTLRPGRQEMNYGAQRLVSALDWTNTRRTFDGARILAAAGDWKVDALAASLVDVDAETFNERNEDRNLYGVYATRAFRECALKSLDLYWLVADNTSVSSNKFASLASAGAELRHTFGTRVAGTCPLTGVGGDVETAWQAGRAAGQDVNAFMVAVELTRKIDFCPLGSSLVAGYDLASGDDDPADGDLKTFNQLYPLGHKYLGFADVLGRQNLQAYQAGLSVPLGKAKASIVHHWFNRHQKRDSAYTVAGDPLRAGGNSDASVVGRELDVFVALPLDGHLTVNAGWSRFFAGPFIKETGASADIDFLYTTVQHTF